MSTRRRFLQHTMFAASLGSGLLLNQTATKKAFAGTRRVCGSPAHTNPSTALCMPAESSPHAATWMAYGATAAAWNESPATAFGRDLRQSRRVARQDLVRLAANLSRFEPVYMLADSPADLAEGRRYLAEVLAKTSVKDRFGNELDNSGNIFIGASRTEADLPRIQTHPITFVLQHINDLWTRDTAPLFSRGADGKLYGVNLNFNCWGQAPISTNLCGWVKDPGKAANGVRDQPIDGDRQIASFINRCLGVPEVRTWLTMEGGGLEQSGTGLAVANESCILNDNRNPGKTKTEVEGELRRLFGVEHVLWMPGVKGEELTDYHIDFTARFASPSQMVYAFDKTFEPPDKRNEIALGAAIAGVNALPPEKKQTYLGSSSALLTARALPLPRLDKVYASFKARNSPSITEQGLDEFAKNTAAGYVGYYEANGCVLLAQYGDAESDRQAFDIVQELYPDRIVMQISTDGICSGGGTLHCATQQQPIA